MESAKPKVNLVFISSRSLSVFLFLIFCLLALAYAIHPAVGDWEIKILSLIGPAANPFLTKFFLFVTYLGSAPIIIFLGVAATFFLERLKARVFIAAVITAELLALLTKILVARPRPAVTSLTAYGFGFPSAHALVGTVFYGLLAYFIFKKAKKAWARAAAASAGAALSILIGFSRIYLGVHWPSDVLGGWVAGLAILILSINFLEKR